MFCVVLKLVFWKKMSGAGVRLKMTVDFLRVKFFSLVGSQCSVREAF